MAQQVHDLALSLLWCRFHPLVPELPCAVGTAKNKMKHAFKKLMRLAKLFYLLKWDTMWALKIICVTV